jgi:hypothetical protein
MDAFPSRPATAAQERYQFFHFPILKPAARNHQKLSAAFQGLPMPPSAKLWPGFEIRVNGKSR